LIKVEVAFLSDVRRMTKEGKTNISLPEKNSVRDLVVMLMERYGANFKEYMLSPENRLQKYMVILVNGRGIGILNGLETMLHEGDSVLIMPAVGGG